MKTLDSGSQRIQKISEELKRDIIDPAKKEAARILLEAKEEAERILEAARVEAVRLHEDAKLQNEQEKQVFQASLAQAAKQTVEALKLEIENKLFNQDFFGKVSQRAADPKTIAKLIDTIMEAIRKEGLRGDISAYIPKHVNPQEVNAFLGEDLLNRLKERGVALGGQATGVQIKLNDKNLTIDMSETALIELLAAYRKDFRKLLFGK